MDFSFTFSTDNINCVVNSSNTNTCSDGEDRNNLIQTEVSRIRIMNESMYTKKSPGENVVINLEAVDEQDISTIAFLQIGVEEHGIDVSLLCIPYTGFYMWVIFGLRFTKV